MLLLVACAIADIDFSGRKCPCADGYECVSGVCLPPGSTPLADAATEASDGSTCTPRRPPTRPSGTTDEPRLSFMTALRRMDVRPAPDFDFPFYDLDGVCTVCPDAGRTASCVGRKEICDEPEGVDRALNGVINFLPLNQDVTSGLVSGRLGIILRVSEYNGLPDDAQVYVDFLFSAGLEGADGAAVSPKFDGTDVFTVIPTSFDGDVPRWHATGWVAGGRLVATLREVLEIDAQYKLPIRESVLVADIQEEGGKRWLGKGTWSGRVEATELLTALGNLAIQGTPLCNTPSTMAPLRRAICDGVDITRVNPSLPDVPCDSLSAATTIEGAPVERLGSFFDRERPPPPCGPAYRESCD